MTLLRDHSRQAAPDASAPLIIGGRAAVWAIARPDRGEQISPSALDHVFVDRAAIPLLLSHDFHLQLAGVRAGGDHWLRLWRGHRGLYFSARLAAGPVADAVERRARAGEWTGCSVRLSRLERSVGKIVRADLDEISLILRPERPAYPYTWVRIERAREGTQTGWQATPLEELRLLEVLNTTALAA
jgi:phage head maturation protease